MRQNALPGMAKGGKGLPADPSLKDCIGCCLICPIVDMTIFTRFNGGIQVNLGENILSKSI
jgi:hypothetical protein